MSLLEQIDQILGVSTSKETQTVKAASTVKAGEAHKTAAQLLSDKLNLWKSRGKDITQILASAKASTIKAEPAKLVARTLSAKLGEKAALEYVASIKAGDSNVKSHLGWLLKGFVPTTVRLLTVENGRSHYNLWHISQCVKTNTPEEIQAVIGGQPIKAEVPKKLGRPKAEKVEAEKVEAVKPAKTDEIAELKAMMEIMAQKIASLSK